MRILQICHKSPFPPAEGGPMAMKAVRDGLISAGHSVHTFTLSTPKFPVVEETAAGMEAFSYCYVDTTVRIWPAFRDLCLNRSYHISRFYHNKTSEQLLQLLRKSEFDAILIESIFMMPYFRLIRENFSGPVILRAHNIEHLIWQRIAENESNILKKRYLKTLSRQLKRFELNCFLQADAIATISEVDEDIVRRMVPAAEVKTIPFAISGNDILFAKKQFTVTFGHIGSMDWTPNSEGIDWFLNDAWPVIHKKHPEAIFRLAGRNMPQRFFNLEKSGIMTVGEVDNAAAFMQQLDLMIVPLLSGSGVRIKIAEALSLGVPVMTTAVGAEGLHVKNGHDIFICTSTDQIINGIDQIIENPGLLKSIADEGLKTIKAFHSSEAVTDGLVSLILKKMKA